MAFNLTDIQKGAKQMSRKVIIYGPPKLGKSTLVGSTDKALMIPTEDRVAHIDCDKTPIISNTKELMEIIETLLNKKHAYKRIIIDTLDWLEPMIHESAVEKINESAKTKATSITDDNCKETAFQKGLKYHAVEAWKRFLYNCDRLRDAGMDVILVAHSQTITINPPDGDAYEKYAMKIEKHALAVLEEWADIIGFYDKKVLVKQEKAGINTKKGKAMDAHRVLYLDGGNPSMIHGNSFGLGNAEDIALKDCRDIMEWILTESYNK